MCFSCCIYLVNDMQLIRVNCTFVEFLQYPILWMYLHHWLMYYMAWEHIFISSLIGLRSVLDTIRVNYGLWTCERWCWLQLVRYFTIHLICQAHFLCWHSKTNSALEDYSSLKILNERIHWLDGYFRQISQRNKFQRTFCFSFYEKIVGIDQTGN